MRPQLYKLFISLFALLTTGNTHLSCICIVSKITGIGPEVKLYAEDTKSVVQSIFVITTETANIIIRN